MHILGFDRWKRKMGMSENVNIHTSKQLSKKGRKLTSKYHIYLYSITDFLPIPLKNSRSLIAEFFVMIVS